MNSRLWERQILHVWVQNEETAQKISIVAEQLLKEHNFNTLVVISKAERSEFIFSNKIKLQDRHVRTISKARSIVFEREAQSSKTPWPAKKNYKIIKENYKGGILIQKFLTGQKMQKFKNYYSIGGKKRGLVRVYLDKHTGKGSSKTFWPAKKTQKYKIPKIMQMCVNHENHNSF